MLFAFLLDLLSPCRTRSACGRVKHSRAMGTVTTSLMRRFSSFFPGPTRGGTARGGERGQGGGAVYFIRYGKSEPARDAALWRRRVCACVPQVGLGRLHLGCTHPLHILSSLLPVAALLRLAYAATRPHPCPTGRTGWMTRGHGLGEAMRCSERGSRSPLQRALHPPIHPPTHSLPQATPSPTHAQPCSSPL